MTKIYPQGKDSTNLWQEIRGAIKESASNVQKVPKKIGSVWETAETLQVIEERRLKKLEGKLVEVRRLNEDIQRGTRQDKEKYYSKKCKVIEKNKIIFQEIREIRGKPKITGVQKKLNEQRRNRKRLNYQKVERIYRGAVYEWPRNGEGFVEMPYQDELTVIRCEVEKALKEIAGRKAEGVDDLQIELLKKL